MMSLLYNSNNYCHKLLLRFLVINAACLYSTNSYTNLSDLFEHQCLHFHIPSLNYSGYTPYFQI